MFSLLTLLHLIKMFLSIQYRHTATRFRFHRNIDCHDVPDCRTRLASLLFSSYPPKVVAALLVICFPWAARRSKNSP